MKRFLFTVFLLSALVISMCLAFQQEELPNLETKVIDLTNTLHQNEIDHVVSKLEALDSNNNSHLIVVIIQTTGDETIKQYGSKLAKKWKTEKSDTKNGILLLVAKKDRKVDIEVINGLEGVLSETYEKRIIDKIIVPQFRSGDFYHGIDQGVDAIISLVNGEKLPIPYEDDMNPTAKSGKAIYLVLFPFAFILLTVINYFAKKKLGRKKGAFITPIILFVIGWWLMNIVGGILVAIFALIFLNIPGGRSIGNKYSGGRYYGGSGGYTIGGGSFKGGGASGSW